jgi:hypothetical protein
VAATFINPSICSLPLVYLHAGRATHGQGEVAQRIKHYRLGAQSCRNGSSKSWATDHDIRHYARSPHPRYFPRRAIASAPNGNCCEGWYSPGQHKKDHVLGFVAHEHHRSAPWLARPSNRGPPRQALVVVRQELVFGCQPGLMLLLFPPKSLPVHHRISRPAEPRHATTQRPRSSSEFVALQESGIGPERRKAMSAQMSAIVEG